MPHGSYAVLRAGELAAVSAAVAGLGVLGSGDPVVVLEPDALVPA